MSDLNGEDVTGGIECIRAERLRQVQVEGWTAEHDAGHDDGALVKAARCYLHAAQLAEDGPRSAAVVQRYIERNYPPTRAKAALEDEDFTRMVENPARHHYGWDEAPDEWPWDVSWWKPSADPERNLVKAGALIAAEIDRLHRGHHGGSASS